MEIIDLEKWERGSTFQHFFHVAKNTYSITVKLDVTDLVGFSKRCGLSFYIALTWIVSKAINEHKQFKMGFDQENNLGYYDVVHPQFPVMDKNCNVVSLTALYEDSFDTFYKKMKNVIEQYELDGIVPEEKPNIIMISTLPWIEYESFTVNNESGYHFLFPMVTWGKYTQEGDRVCMPLTLQISHAVADGYHCHLFFESVKKVMEDLKLAEE